MSLVKEELTLLEKRIKSYKKTIKANGKLCPEKAENDLMYLLYSCGVKDSDNKLFLKLEDEIGIIIDECFKRSK